MDLNTLESFRLLSPELQKTIEKRFEKPTVIQQLVIPRILKGTNVLAIAPTGVGKCVGKDTLILTPEGPKEIREFYRKKIKVNSVNQELKTEVFTGFIVQKRISKLYEVETNTGRRIKVTDDHKFLTIRNGNLLWMPLKDLRINDYVAITRRLKLFEQKPKITFNLFEEYINERICFGIYPQVSKILKIIKEQTGFSLKTIGKIVGCHEATLLRGKKGKCLSGKTIKNLLNLADMDENKIEVKAISFPGSKTFIIPKIDENFAHFIGLIVGDGNFNKNRTIRFTTASSDLLNLFRNYLSKIGLILGKDRSKKYDYYTSSKPLLYLLYSLNLPRRNKSSNAKIPAIFFDDYNLLAAVLRGIYDTDGSIYGNTIELTTKSKRLAEEMLLALSCFGIVAIRKIKIVERKKYQKILIHNLIDRKLFHDKIDFFKPDKKIRLMNSLKYSSNPNLDVIPEITNMLKRLKEKMNVSHIDTYEDKLYYAYVGMRARNPSRSTLLRILHHFVANSSVEILPSEFSLLNKLALSDIFWDKIKSINESSSDYVYDASVPETKNFIGNGIVLHNTEAAMLAIFDQWLKIKPAPISILYITPLRSLNRDLLDRLLWWGQEIGMEITVRHGDTSAYERRLQTLYPNDMFITTPETLQAILPGKVIKEHLRNVKFVIIDEVHELVDSKRGTQLAVALERLRELTGEDFQIVGLSATVGSPEHVAKFISPNKDIEIVKAVTSKQMQIKVVSPKVEDQDKKTANKLNSSPETASRLRTIMDYINNSRSVLVFTNTREFAEVLANRIKTIDRKFPSLIHHSSLSKDVRITAEKEFKEEKIKAIISTSSLQLGIDIGSIDLVLQYMSPRQVSQLIQRVGRSGHEFQRVSKGIIVATDEDDIFEASVIARKALNEELEPLVFHQNSYDVLAHQLVGLTMDQWRLDVQKTYEIIKRSYPFKNLSFSEFLEVCKQLQQIHLVFLDQNITKKRRGFEYYFNRLSTIPDSKQFKVVNMLDQTFVGVLDEEFVALHGSIGTTFVLKGESYRIVQTEEDKVMVEPTIDIEAAIPGWEGELIPVPFDVSQEVGRLRAVIQTKLKEKNEKNVAEDLIYSYPVDENTAKRMVKVVRDQLKYGIVPDDRTVLVEDFENIVVIHSCFGTVVNETLGRFLTALLTNRMGSVGMRIDPYRIILQFQSKNLEILKEILFKTNPLFLKDYVEMSLTRSSLFEWKFVHVAKRFGVLSRDAEYGKMRLGRIIDTYVGTPVFKETLRELETEKLDIEKTTEILKRIQSSEIAVVFKPGLSPIGKIGMRQRFAEVVGPKRPEVEIFDLFKQRLFNTKIRLACMNCGMFDQTFVLRELKEETRCRKCQAKLLAVVHPRNSEILKIIKKKIRNREMTVDEIKKYEIARKTADLFIVYGKKAVVALAAKGVGPMTARRILSQYHKSDEELLRDLLEAERNFIKTRKFWAV